MRHALKIVDFMFVYGNWCNVLLQLCFDACILCMSYLVWQVLHLSREKNWTTLWVCWNKMCHPWWHVALYFSYLKDGCFDVWRPSSLADGWPYWASPGGDHHGHYDLTATLVVSSLIFMWFWSLLSGFFHPMISALWLESLPIDMWCLSWIG